MAKEAHIRQTALDIIARIAPEADIANLDPNDRFRNQFDFDSVDFMNFAVALQDQLGVEIPEKDFPQLTTLNSSVAYLQAKLH